MDHTFFTSKRSLAIVGALCVMSTVTATFAATNNAFVSITDGKDRVGPGGDLVYVVTMQQNNAALQYTDVSVTLPSYVNIVSPDNGGRVVGNIVLWDRVPLSQGEAKRFSINVNLIPSVPENTLLTATVQAGGSIGSDSTVVQSTFVNNLFQVSVTDDTDLAQPAQLLNYTVKVKNTAAFSQRADVFATVSDFTSIQTTNPGAQIAYPRITWQNVSFAANEQKTFTFTANISKRITSYTALYTTAKVGSVVATDATRINSPKVQQQASSSRSSVSSSSTASESKHILFRKVSDANDVVPGGTIHYTLYVQNVLLHVIDDAVITDRFDPTMLSVENAGGATQAGEGVLKWTLPALQPGQIWKRTYALRVSPDLENGTLINTVATLSGNDVAFTTLNEKVTVSSSGVIGVLPATGAAFDLLFLLGVLPFALATMTVQKKARV